MDADFSTWRVLAVDDEPDNLKLITDLLGFKGASVESTLDARRGLALVDTFEPNVILLDLAMPGMDGWEMHRQLRLRSELDHVPIIAITALAMQSDADRAMKVGFDGYITKPFRMRALLERLVACVETFNDRRINVDS